MKISTQIALSLTGWLFFFHTTSAQSINRNAWNFGLSTGIAHMGGNKTFDVNGYYHAGLNFGYFPATGFALGLELNISNISFDDGPYTAFGI